jgi:hypothetical protein
MSAKTNAARKDREVEDGICKCCEDKGAKEAFKEVGGNALECSEEGRLPWSSGGGGCWISGQEDVGSKEVAKRGNGSVFEKLQGGLRVSNARKKAGGIRLKTEEDRVKKLALERSRANGLAKEADTAIGNQGGSLQLLGQGGSVGPAVRDGEGQDQEERGSWFWSCSHRQRGPRSSGALKQHV